MGINLNQTAFGSIPGPEDITRVELANGIIVLARANFNSPSVMVSGYLPVGGLFDSDEKLGLADFISAALMRGTAKRDFQKIYDDLESVGASLGFGGGTHTTGFNGRSMVEDLDLLMGLLAETLRQPTFPEEQIERLRAQLLTGLELRSQNTAAMAALTFDELIYAGHPYSRSEEGHPETIQAITLQDLETFHHLNYGPRGMVIAVVGGIDPQEAVDKISSKLSDWHNPHQPPSPSLPEWTPLEKGVTNRLEIQGKSQSDLFIGTAGPMRSSPDYMAASLGNNILGRFGMMGRIGEVVRVQSGLAYYAYSSLNGGLGPGPWTAMAGVNPTNEKKVVNLIEQEIKRFVTELVSEEELSDSQSNYIGRLPLSLESNAGVAGAMLVLERYQLGLDYYQRYPELVNAVTRQDIMAAAANYLDPERLGIAVAGPPKIQG
ncbi:MAG: insulinase family protein [Chloroflexi bacterium]|nr:insulinase family protein [Chloroflexota bacterium]